MVYSIRNNKSFLRFTSHVSHLTRLSGISDLLSNLQCNECLPDVQVETVNITSRLQVVLRDFSLTLYWSFVIFTALQVPIEYGIKQNKAA